MRIVIDTNIIISGIFFGGKPRELLKQWFSGNHTVLCSEEILREYINTIEKLTEKSKRDIGMDIVPLLLENIEMIKNKFQESYSRDPDDDKFINCARSGNAKYIISGDKDLLVLENIAGINIIEISEFLKLE
jgi:putative PIN family toxin of toxin-antitoxin system